MYGGGIVLLRKHFQNFIVLVGQGSFFVSEIMRFSNGRLHWDIQFCRPLQDWKSESFDLFWVVLYSMNVRGVGDDKLCWKPARRRSFEV